MKEPRVFGEFDQIPSGHNFSTKKRRNIFWKKRRSGQCLYSCLQETFLTPPSCNYLGLPGRCDPDDLKVDEDQKRPPPLPPPPRLPEPPRPEEEDDPVTDIEAELLWENQPHPPRGDVPHRRPFLDYGDGDPQDQAAPGSAHSHAYRQQLGAGPRSSGGSAHRVRHGELKVRGQTLIH